MLKNSLIVISLISLNIQAEYKMVLLDSSYKNSVSIEDYVETSTPDQGGSTGSNGSCKAILDSGDSIGNGVYTLNNGSDYQAYCDMTNSGGWTLVSAQFESNPVSWDEGIQVDYDPTLSSGQSFTLNSSELPSHTETMFYSSEANGNPIANNGYFNYVYTTGQIAKTLISSNGTDFHIARLAVGYYPNHDPDYDIVPSTSGWDDTLTVNRIIIGGEDYAFSPKIGAENNRGYAYGGSPLYGSYESFAWTIWVR